jgi:Flp pilus assembly protein TadG
MFATLRRFARATHANAATEFALVLPVMLTFAAGATEFGRAYQVYDASNKLATQYAIAFADCSDNPAGTCGTEAAMLAASNSIANVAPQLIVANTSLQLFEVQMSGTTPTVVYAAGYPSTPSGLTAAQSAAASAAFSSGQTGVVVTVSYVHSLVYFPALMAPLLGGNLNPTYTITQLKY